VFRLSLEPSPAAEKHWKRVGAVSHPQKKRDFFEGFTRWIVNERAAGDASLGGGCVVWANQTKKRLLL
jgi:hypothetical protein